MKNIIFYILIALLFVPLAQVNFNFVELKPLRGSYILTEKPDSISQNWFTEKFQKQYDRYFNEQLGFRNILIRFNNQLKFFLFKKTSTNKVRIGKNGYLFELDYINEFYGWNYIGDKEIKKEVDRIKELQQNLKNNNVLLIPVLNTGKGSFYSEYMPERFKKNITQTNYSEFIKHFNEENIFYIDLRKKFLDLKKTSKYPLFPKTGIHWTKLGATLGISEIIRQIEHEKGIDIRDFEYFVSKCSDNLMNVDKDIELAMNLMYPLNRDKMAYPTYKFDTSKSFDNVDILMVGDSYCFNIFETKILRDICNNYEFWYYNNSISPYRVGRTKVSRFNNYKQEVLKFDVVLLMVTESNYQHFDLGFYNKYINADENEINKVIERIKSDKKWFENVKKQALEREISVDSMLVESANFVIKARNKTNKTPKDNSYDIELRKVIENIKRNKEWLKNVKLQAKNRGISIEKMLVKSAKYTISQR